MTLITTFGSQSTARGARRFSGVFFLCLLAATASAGCGSHSPEQKARRAEAAGPGAHQAQVAPTRLPVDPPGLHNVVRLGEGLFSGSEPDGPDGFASIARLGVKTIVSVDGARPNVDFARREGMRYVHVPFGYDGVPRRAGLALARLVRETEEPIYIHCHHGRHRGPAAAAIAWIASGKAGQSEALEVLETAGTGKEYPGLWRDVRNYASPSAETELPELLETAPVESLAAGMANIDRHWDDLKRCRDAQWQAPKEHPDLSPAQESLQLREAFYEAGRVLPADRFDKAFRARLQEAESFAAEIETALQQSHHEAARRALSNLERCCKQCHEAYRN
jgi:hypothetical protein